MTLNADGVSKYHTHEQEKTKDTCAQSRKKKRLF
jgi:hypothetical protein